MMQICPKCGAYYADDSLAFCLVDGMPLVKVDPSSQKWSEGSRAIREKESALREHKRKLKWRRAWAGLITALVTITLAYVLVARGFIGVEHVTPPPILFYKISGRVMDARKPLGGVNITLEGGAKTVWTETNRDGNYTFDSLPSGGSYTITPTPAAKIDFTPLTRSINHLARDESADFSGLVKPEVYKISGKVMDASKPLGDISIKLEGGIKPVLTTTDAHGNYTFSALPSGRSYTVTPIARAKMTFSPATQPINNLIRDESADFSGLVKEDSTSSPKSECDADEIQIRAIVTARLQAPVGPAIKTDRPGVVVQKPQVDSKQVRGSLGKIEEITFYEKCTVASVKISYLSPEAAAVNKNPLSCTKRDGKWGCP